MRLIRQWDGIWGWAFEERRGMREGKSTPLTQKQQNTVPVLLAPRLVFLVAGTVISLVE